MTERAYKFTRAGAISPFTGFAWPVDEWVEADGPLGLGANGIHACRVEALPRWLDDELWELDVEDVADEIEGVVVARRARLRNRVEAWNAACSHELARFCARRARELADEHPEPLLEAIAGDVAVASESADPSATAASTYCVAAAAERVVAGGYWLERRRQADWLRFELGLG